MMSGVLSHATEWIEFASLVIEILAVAIIVGSVFYSTARFVYMLAAKKNTTAINYRD
jgi:hypothetical protein